jgi:hypothetical protein
VISVTVGGEGTRKLVCALFTLRTAVFARVLHHRAFPTIEWFNRQAVTAWSRAVLAMECRTKCGALPASIVTPGD